MNNFDFSLIGIKKNKSEKSNNQRSPFNRKRERTFNGNGQKTTTRKNQRNGFYRHAWEMIKKMNTISDAPLVIKNTGGSSGGGSVVTKEG